MRNLRGAYCVLLVFVSVFLASCGGGGNIILPPPVTYSLSGTVSNLYGTGNSVELTNGSDTVTVNANGNFTFPDEVSSGTPYSITVTKQPSSPTQTCGVTHGAGTATANVTDIAVDCGHNEWTWMGGADVINEAGTYGTQGTPAPGNIPGARMYPTTWTDASGNIWLFGGCYIYTGVSLFDVNDLWEYSGGQWTWMNGSNIPDQPGTYGTQGTPDPGNIPGARCYASASTGTNHDFWLFGGTGRTGGNDLWKYSANQWTWVSGSNSGNPAGTYGTLGTAAPDNVPGGRWGSISWMDTSGDFWLFGGYGFDSTGASGFLNDLWKYSGGQWTWMSGSDLVNQAGTYGTQGTPAPGNVPPPRLTPVAWTDTTGNLWLFGGATPDAGGNWVQLNDLWKFSGGQWTWMGGANTPNQTGTYGTLGTAAPGNVPGARSPAAAWTDASGNFWLFGGWGNDSAGTAGILNDLWKYSGGQWTWMSGSNVANQTGTYGTQGTPAPGNVPPARNGAVGWIDSSGKLWFFGGYTATRAYLNDLWMYEP
jgi:hypothetical protein